MFSGLYVQIFTLEVYICFKENKKIEWNPWANWQYLLALYK